MKKFFYAVLFLCLIVSGAWADVEINAANFPDKNFRDYLSGNFDTDNDGMLNNEEIAQIIGIYLYGQTISSLKGIEYLTALNDLRCDSAYLTELDVSKNLALTNLYCYDGKLTELDVSKNTALTKLYCYNNQLTKLDVSKNAALQALVCYDNHLTELDVSQNTALTVLACGNNQLTELELRRNTALEHLHCSNNQLTELNVSNHTALASLECDNNRIVELDLSKNTALTILVCSNNQLTDLNLSNNINLGWVDFGEQFRYGLKITEDDIGGFQVNLSDYIADFKNICSDVIVYCKDGLSSPMKYKAFYDAETGIASFPVRPAYIKYSYNVYIPARSCYVTMYVTISDEKIPKILPDLTLKIDALERGRGDNNIIYNMDNNNYFEAFGSPIDETYITIANSQLHKKSGFTADGNSRLILRVQSNKPGSATFTLKDDIGATLENLQRVKSTSSLDIMAVQTGSLGYQASAVLIAPETFPSNKTFPSDKFTVQVKFKAEDGSETSENLTLDIEATPIILIHGLRGSAGGTFGIGKDSGIWNSLNKNKFNISWWNYDGTKGPSELLADNWNGLVQTVFHVLDSYGERGIACTKVDFVCHSMGGLMARKFLEEKNKNQPDGNNWTVRSYKQGTVRRVITVATPHRGSPWADLLVSESVLNPALRKVTNAILNLLGGSIGQNADSAYSDLLTNAPRDYGFPSNVPMYSIYGDSKDDISKFATLLDIAGGALGYVEVEHGTLALLINLVSYELQLMSDTIETVFHDMFAGEGHDTSVSVSSAMSDFSGKGNNGHIGWDYKHTSICKQDDVGKEVVRLLKGSADNFKIFGSSTSTTASSENKIASKKLRLSAEESEFNFIEAINLEVEPVSFKIANNNSQTVTFKAIPNDSATHDIYCVMQVGNDDNYKIFKMSEADNNFEAKLIFTSQDTGIMHVFCFSHNPNDADGTSLNVSNKVQISALPDTDKLNIARLDFLGNSGIYTNVNSDVAAVVYAVTDEGEIYDVSSPSLGTEWTSQNPEIAFVNDYGRVEAIKGGATTLTAEFKGFSASISVDVSATSEYPDEYQDPEEGQNPDPGGGSSGGCDSGIFAGAFMVIILFVERK